MVRTFIGIELEQNVVAEFSQELSYLKYHFPKIKWVHPQNLHITLKFLGNIQPNSLREVFTAMEIIGREALPFTLALQSVLLLPDSERPTVVCSKAGRGTEELLMLQRKVSLSCSALGYPEDHRPYLPHITLGRIKAPSYALGFEDYLADLANTDFGLTEVEEVIVYMSELGNNGAEYSPMYRVRLEG